MMYRQIRRLGAARISALLAVSIITACIVLYFARKTYAASYYGSLNSGTTAVISSGPTPAVIPNTNTTSSTANLLANVTNSILTQEAVSTAAKSAGPTYSWTVTSVTWTDITAGATPVVVGMGEPYYPTISENFSSTSPSMTTTFLGAEDSLGTWVVNYQVTVTYTDQATSNTWTGVATLPVTFYVSGIEILQVPEYLFADAKYATPVEFELFDPSSGPNFTAASVSVTLYNDDQQIAAYSPNTNPSRLVAGAAIANAPPASSGSAIYTFFVPATAYSGISLSPTPIVNWTVEFTVSASVTGSATGAVQETLVSDWNDPNGTVEEFADPTIFAVDMGVPGNAATSITVPFSTWMSAPGHEGWGGMERPYPPVGATYPPLFPDPTVPPFNQNSVYVYTGAERDLHWGPGNDQWQSWITGEYPLVNGAYPAGNAGATATGFPNYEAYTYLYCDGTNAGSQPGWGVKNRYFGLRDGGYFYVSYPGITVPLVLGSEVAMNVGIFDGSFNITMFDWDGSKGTSSGAYEGKYSIVCNSGTGAPAMTSPDSMIATAVLSISAAVTDGGTAAAFNIMNAIFTAAATTDSQPPAPTYQGASGTVIRTLANISSSGVISPGDNYGVLSLFSTGNTGWLPANMDTNKGIDTIPGDQWQAIIDIDSEVDQVSINGGPPAEVYNDTKFSSGNGAAQSFTVKIHALNVAHN